MPADTSLKERSDRRDAFMPSGLVRVWAAARAELVLRSAERFLMFVGYPRSGHSLVGQLLNAHPEALVSHEADVGRLVAECGFGRRQVVVAILEQERDFAAAERVWNDFSYAVPGVHQGRTARPVLVGDKKGGDTSRLLQHHPDLLSRVRATIGLPLTVLHVRRHPLDNIATMARRSNSGRVDLAAERWLAMRAAVEVTRDRGDWDSWIDVDLDDLIAEPQETLEKIRARLGLRTNAAWLKAAAGRVATNPSRTRTQVEWPDDVLGRLATGGVSIA